MKLNKKEIYFLVLVSFILIVITSLPILYGYLIRGDLFYGGLHIFSPLDGSVYYSYIQQVKDGKILLDDLFTNEIGGLKLFNIFWLSVGLLGRILYLTPALAYQLSRIILIPVFIVSLYKFISYVLASFSVGRKKLGLLYSIFATGVGGLTILLFGNRFFNNNPIDLQVPESSSFLTLFYSPHFIASLTLIILIFYFFLQGIEKNKVVLGVWAGLLALVLFNFHPFFVPVIYSVSILYLIAVFIWQRRVELKKISVCLLLLLISSPSVGYYFYLLALSPALRDKAAQNNCFTPAGLIFFVSYGFGLIMALVAFVYFVNNKKFLNYKNLFLLVWFLLGIFLVFSPLNFQRRLTEGLQIPLTILAFIGLVAIYDYLRGRSRIFVDWKYIFLPVFILLFCFSNFLVYSWDFKYIKLKPPVIFIDVSVKQALNWYRDESNFEQTLLSARLVGNFTPGLTGRRVFWGHDVETVNFAFKKNQVEWFFRDNANDFFKKEFLKSQRIDFIFYSSEEKKLGAFDPAKKSYLAQIFHNNGADIYQVILK